MALPWCQADPAGAAPGRAVADAAVAPASAPVPSTAATLAATATPRRSRLRP